MSQTIQGVLPVVHMPYNIDLSIDYGALEVQIDWLFATGAQGFCLALVSDLLRLSAQERLELPADLVRFAKGRGPVVISVGAESTLQAQAFARAAQGGGAAAVMAIPPLSRALSEDQLRAYFEGILEAVEIPLIVQDASSYVGKAMSIDFQAGLFQRHGQRILFKPEATPLGPCISALRASTGGKAALFEGSGGVLLIDSHRRGVTGTIPGVELLDGTVALWRALEAGDEERAYALYFPICAIVVLQMQGGLDGFIVTERHLMVKRGLFKSQIHRGPLSFELDPETRAELDRLFARLQKALHS
ncbi:MAG: dihydrodipicolinate synthase family protein [Candidatus Latescibacteria bacterium]|nr:dihydrodipicolinate synthase family protein [Candidatus Latescibacterota bacterium]